MQVPIQRRSSRWETVHEGQWFTEVPLDVVSKNIIITVESLHGQSFKEGFHEIEVYTGNSMYFFSKQIHRSISVKSYDLENSSSLCVRTVEF